MTLSMEMAVEEIGANCPVELHFMEPEQSTTGDRIFSVRIQDRIVLENLVPVEGTRFVDALEAASLPLYAVFFSLAGATVHLSELAAVWQWALVLVGVRALAIFLGTSWGARLGRSPEVVRRTAWGGFVSQAGVALGMATLLAQEFPTWGAQLQGFFVGMVAVHELAGPVLAKWTLDRAGEVGAGGSPESIVPGATGV